MLARLGATSVKSLANTALCYPRMLLHYYVHALACSPATVSSAAQTLLKDPLPSNCNSSYRSPTCNKYSHNR